MFRKMMIAATALMIATPALAERPTRVLYMEVDDGKGLIARNTQAFQRIFDHTGNYLHHQRIRLFEEKSRERAGERSFEDAMNVASQSRRKNLDAVVMVSVKHKQQRKGPRLEDRLIATAHIVDARSLKVIDTIRVKSPIATIRKNKCRDECIDMVKRRHVREILPEFKGKLVDRLKGYHTEGNDLVRVTPTAKGASRMTLTLKGFTPREVRHLEDRIARLEGTRDLSSLQSRPGKPAFWLERKENAANVRDDLGRVLANLDLSARIVQTERQVTLIKVQDDLAYLN